MKKTLFTLLSVFVCFVFLSCSKDENNTSEEENFPKIIGTWESGNYFVSFGNDGFYSAYIGDEFIDSGDYDLSMNTVPCSNHYFNRKPYTR